jgi:2-hydroxy-6-oxonona-2,4-dienedioate hydrolase
MGAVKSSVGIGLAAILGVVYRQYRKELGEAKRRLASTGKIIHTECGPLGYADIGQGPVVLAIHGAGGGYDQGLFIAGQNGLSERDYRIIAPSRFGYLQTPLPERDATPARQADAHACLLDALGIQEQVAVIGTSAGALSAMQFAIKYPGRVSTLVLQVPDSWAPPESRGSAAAQVAGSDFILNVVLRLDFLMWAFMKLARRNMLTFMGIPKGL